ncbi:MAG: hypothetical protein PHR06_09330 [Candidatus Cloacimonetes bacterium]|nr:hypothetical protein [Candidatus Cloacimonadota bacterium]
MLRRTVFLLLFFVFTWVLLLASERIAVLPVSNSMLDEQTNEGIWYLLIQEITAEGNFSAASMKEVMKVLPEASCDTFECAIAVADSINCDYALISRIIKLGEKIIFDYSLINVAEEKIVVKDNTTVDTIEDMDVVVKRIAKSVSSNQKFDQTADINTVTISEEKSFKKRGLFNCRGITWGYLFPNTGYNNTSRSKLFTIAMELGSQTDKFEYGTNFAYRNGFAMDIYANHLFTKTDFCPYFGGAIGIHWIITESNYDDRKIEEGLGLTVNSGILMFHTYKNEVKLNFSYTATFEDKTNEAVFLTIGIKR